MLNQVILECNIVRKDELRFSSHGKAYLPMTVVFKTAEKKENGWGEKKHYIRATLWGKSAQSLSDHIRPGTPIIIRGKLNHNIWKKSNGQQGNSYFLTIEDFHFPHSRKRKIPND